MKADSLEQLTECHQRAGFRFALSPDCPSVERLMALVTGKTTPERFFRQGRRRNVMLLEGMIVKLYEFHKLSDLLHSGRYAPREVECYHDYVKAFGNLEGFRLPKLYGYFENPLLFCLYRANGIVNEYIPDTHELTSQELMLTVPLFAHLYRKGIYHPDMQLKNILYQSATHTIVPIDYMGTNLLHEPSWEALLIEMAHFLKMGNIPEEAGRPFVEAVFQSLPELRLDMERGWSCIKKIWGLYISTHQYHHPIFLPDWLRHETMP
ncbi:MAG: hypothetical protein IKP00_05670 [Victivallales bacterium]|nr:hypothetical protein [Victivallales bacterium]